jgi:hypothetical protein
MMACIVQCLSGAVIQVILRRVCQKTHAPTKYQPRGWCVSLCCDYAAGVLLIFSFKMDPGLNVGTIDAGT